MGSRIWESSQTMTERRSTSFAPLMPPAFGGMAWSVDLQLTKSSRSCRGLICRKILHLGVVKSAGSFCAQPCWLYLPANSAALLCLRSSRGQDCLITG